MFKKTMTVDSVLAAFNTTIASLRQVEADHAAAATTHDTEAAALQAKAEAARAESTRAAKVAGQLEGLIGKL